MDGLGRIRVSMVALVILLALLAGCSQEQQAREDREKIGYSLPQVVSGSCQVDDSWLNHDYDSRLDYANPDIKTDFFLLVYSHSPGFCERERRSGRAGRVPFQCKSPNTFGWVVHGLWGESEMAYVEGQKNRHPRFCQGDLPPLRLEQLKQYLCIMPGTNLLQGEWEKHGACDFAGPEEYFGRIRELYTRFRVPPAELQAKRAMHWMKANNPQLKNLWLHLSRGEFGICLDRKFQPISCPRRN